MSDTETCSRRQEEPVIKDKISDDTSDDDSIEAEAVVNGATDDSSSSSAAPAKCEEDLDTDSDEEGQISRNGRSQTPDSGFTRDGDQDFKPKKATESDSSDTEDDQEEYNKEDIKDSDEEDDEILGAKLEHTKREEEDVRDGCISSKVAEEKDKYQEDDNDEVYELSRTPSPVDLMDDTPMMRKSSTPSSPARAPLASVARTPTPDPTSSPLHMIDDDIPISKVESTLSSPVHAPLAPLERDSSPERSPSPEDNNEDPMIIRKDSTPSSPVNEALTTPLSPLHEPISSLARSPSPDRKDSRGSHGSSSYDEERASSLSPEPTKTIQTPSSAVQSPMSPPPSSNSKNALTKIYTAALGDSDSEEKKEKSVRAKPAGDITQIYTQKLVEKQEQQANSPRTERKSMTFQRPEGMTNITQLYTAAFKEEKGKETGDKIKPQRNGDITKLYTGGLDHGPDSKFKGKPRDELTNPIKHNMATSVDKSAIMDAYNEVMADNNEVEWAAFTFDGNKLGVTATGNDFAAFKSHFGPDDRGFGYIKVKTGDEMSKRSKFVFCTWVGPNVSVMKKAKMSTDKALLKEIITNLSVELLIETAAEFTPEHFKAEVDKAGGARYGTGMRD